MNNETVTTSQVLAPTRALKSFFKNLSRRNCLLVTLAFAAIVLAFKSSQLAAMGISPLLLAFLPCLAMCALGLCKKGDSVCSKSAENGANH